MARTTNYEVVAEGYDVRYRNYDYAEIKAREQNGLVELPRRSLQPGDRVRVLQGPLAGQIGLYDGMKPRERVAVLLTFLGGPHRVSLPREDLEPV